MLVPQKAPAASAPTITYHCFWHLIAASLASCYCVLRVPAARLGVSPRLCLSRQRYRWCSSKARDTTPRSDLRTDYRRRQLRREALLLYLSPSPLEETKCTNSKARLVPVQPVHLASGFLFMRASCLGPNSTSLQATDAQSLHSTYKSIPSSKSRCFCVTLVERSFGSLLKFSLDAHSKPRRRRVDVRFTANFGQPPQKEHKERLHV